MLTVTISQILPILVKIDGTLLRLMATESYIMIQFLANYDEKYELVENLNKETLTKLMEDNLDNPYINWDMIYYHFEDKYKYKYTFGYLGRFDTIVLNVLFKFSRKLKQENDFW